VEKAMESEIIRQAEMLDRGESVVLQTRRYDVKKDTTVLLRKKEKDLDYRFMYDPDLPSYFISPEMIKSAEKSLDLVPFDLKKQLKEEFSLTVEQVQFMYSLPELVDYFKSLCSNLGSNVDPQLVYNWIFIIFTGNWSKVISSYYSLCIL